MKALWIVVALVAVAAAIGCDREGDYTFVGVTQVDSIFVTSQCEKDYRACLASEEKRHQRAEADCQKEKPSERKRCLKREGVVHERALRECRNAFDACN